MTPDEAILARINALSARLAHGRSKKPKQEALKACSTTKARLGSKKGQTSLLYDRRERAHTTHQPELALRETP